jgi:hypothetical protein
VNVASNRENTGSKSPSFRNGAHHLSPSLQVRRATIDFDCKSFECPKACYSGKPPPAVFLGQAEISDMLPSPS